MIIIMFYEFKNCREKFLIIILFRVLTKKILWAIITRKRLKFLLCIYFLKFILHFTFKNR